MNYRGNAFSAGSGNITSARQIDNKIHFLQKQGSVFVYRVFDPKNKTFTTLQQPVSYADSCFFGDAGGLIELFGTMVKLTQV